MAVSLAGFASPPLKIGVGRIVPIAYLDENGTAVGFAVDVVNEAARREQISVSWVKIRKSFKEDLQSGMIDLVPAGIATEERKHLFYVSEPWWSDHLSLLTRAGTSQVRRLGIQQVYIEFARPYFDPATFVHDLNWRTDSVDIEAQGVCNGTLDGALITQNCTTCFSIVRESVLAFFCNRPIQLLHTAFRLSPAKKMRPWQSGFGSGLMTSCSTEHCYGLRSHTPRFLLPGWFIWSRRFKGEIEIEWQW
jgi:hypothetical protein